MFIFFRRLTFFEWFHRFQPGNRVHSTLKTHPGSKVKPLLATLNESENAQMSDVVDRAKSLAQAAQDHGVRLMVDAEQTYFQPAIHHIAVNVLMPRYNLTTPTIYNTIQSYLRVSALAVQHDALSSAA